MNKTSFLAGAILWLAASFTLQAGTAVQVNVSGLNVRSGPSTANTILGQVWNAQKYSYEGRSGSWNMIRFDNRLGYVYGGSNYSSTTTAHLGTITASALNVRSGPGSNYGAVGQVRNGQRFVLTGSTSGSWLEIYHGGNKRWVYGSYVRQESSVAPPPPPPPPAPVASPINISFFSLGSGSPTTTSSRFITTRHFYQSNGATVRDYRMSENANFSGAFWRSYTSRPSFTLSAGNGTKRVYIQFRDTSLRPSNTRSDSIVLSIPSPTPAGLARSINRTKWFNNYRAIWGGLSQSKLDGINFLLANIERDTRPDSNAAVARRQLAYVMATTKHEVADTYQPITEFGNRNCPRYDGGCTYKGRGYVQLTHRYNYERMSDVVGVDLVANPERALEPNIAYPVMSYGMFNGSFTGVGVGRYINSSQTDYWNARRVVNGTDKASLIQGYANNFQSIFDNSVN